MIGNCSTQVADMTAPTDKNILQPFLGSYKKQQLSRSSHSAKTEREIFRVVRWTPRHHLRTLFKKVIDAINKEDHVDSPFH
ncbi:hypothetical protein T09_14341 [Trichinella sp. T9]|nr:hypothetical protein T09_14341 [Trichinella sp. T9]